VGDKLVSTKFPQTITRGFASVDDRNVAVCLLPGTELAFEEEVACETRFAFGSRRQTFHKVARFREVNKGLVRVRLLTTRKSTIRSPSDRPSPSGLVARKAVLGNTSPLTVIHVPNGANS
jgi:hypothetical protein